MVSPEASSIDMVQRALEPFDVRVVDQGTDWVGWLGVGLALISLVVTVLIWWNTRQLELDARRMQMIQRAQAEAKEQERRKPKVAVADLTFSPSDFHSDQAGWLRSSLRNAGEVPVTLLTPFLETDEGLTLRYSDPIDHWDRRRMAPTDLSSVIFAGSRLNLFLLDYGVTEATIRLRAEDTEGNNYESIRFHYTVPEGWQPSR